MIENKVKLPLASEIVAGRIEAIARSGRTLLLGGNALTLWSLYPFQRGWIREGDQVIVVSQRLPINTELRFLLAFWSGAPHPIRGVAAITHTLSIAIAAACLLIFKSTPVPFASLWEYICTASIVVSTAYLALMLRARANLRRFIDASVS